MCLELGRKGKQSNPLLLPQSRDMVLSGEGFRNEGTVEWTVGYASEGRLLSEQHTGLCKAKKTMVGGCDSGVPCPESRISVTKKSGYSPRARAGLSFPACPSFCGRTRTCFPCLLQRLQRRVHGHSFLQLDGAGLLRASGLGMEQDRVRTALRRKWEPKASTQDTMKKELPFRVGSPLGLAGLPSF